jgi:HSP20 family protein
MKQFDTHHSRGKQSMLVRYWQPWREMDLMRNQLDQLFNEMTQTPKSQSKPTAWRPAIELKDEGNNIVVRAQLPGVDAKDLNVEVTKEAVSISGERQYEQKNEENRFFKSEFHYGQFQRIVPLPAAVQNDKVQAEYKDGILTLTLPKVEEVRNQVVKVNLTNQEQPTA